MNVTNEELSGLKPLVVAVVGPTNEGKTSILRTLTNDPYFGNINAYTGTTSRAEIQKVFYKGVAELLQLVDTPGFQTSSEILDLVLQLPEVEENNGDFGLEEIMRAIPRVDEDFRHDLRAWREIERADLVILVASVVEDPTKSLLKNSLRLLKNIGRPVVVAYNNIRDADELTGAGALADFRQSWEETLRKNNFFLVQEYDAHRRSFAHEIELFEKIAALTRNPLTQRVLRLEMRERRALEKRRYASSRSIIAELLIDVAAYREIATNVEECDRVAKMKEIEEKLKEKVVRREHDAQLDILKAWDFRSGFLSREMLDISEIAKESDEFFGKDAKRHLSVGGGAGVAVGAALGLALDAASAGITLGAGLALGTFLGGLVGGGGAAAYNSKYDAKRKRLVARSDRRVVDALLARAVELTQALATRGKAIDDTSTTLVSRESKPIEIPNVTNALNKYESFPAYSRLNETDSSSPKEWNLTALFSRERKTRAEVIEQIAEALKEALPDVD